MADFEPQEIRPEQIVPERPQLEIVPGELEHDPKADSLKPLRFPGQYSPILDRYRVLLIWLFQVAVFLGVNGVWSKFGASPVMWVTGCGVYVLLCVVIGWHMWQAASTPDPLPRKSLLMQLMRAGVLITFLATLALVWALWIRIEPSNLRTVTTLLLALFAILTLGLSLYALGHRATPWFQFVVGVTAIPILLGWCSATFASWLFYERPWVSVEALKTGWQNELAKRSKWALHPGWIAGEKNRPIVVAVALSGGGYRAAAIHAGVLSALESRCVPIRYLSTVSGGSIVGASYALGYSPEQFKIALIEHKPGLPDDLLSIVSVFFDWFLPGWSSADTYARHLDHVFFHSATLANTGTAPQLVVNATDIQQDANHAREVFFWDPRRSVPHLNGTPVAEVVAASGAFPGAFDPKTIEWTAADGKGKPGPRRFVDGGVVENLGVTGLERLFVLTRTAQSQLTPEPDLLIISDASRLSSFRTLSQKVDLLQLLIRSEGISYDMLRNHVLKNVDGKWRPVLIPATQEEGIKTLASKTFDSIAGDKIARDVAGFDTLKELDEQEVKKAFWVGETLTMLLWEKIDGARKAAGASGSPCPTPVPIAK